MKTIHFISGLPRSGGSLIANILKQNPNIHGEAESSLAQLFNFTHINWNEIQSNILYDSTDKKKGVLLGTLQGYFNGVNKPVVFDNNKQWVSLIPIIEQVLQKQVKVIICVRNPAEILTCYEKIRRDNLFNCNSIDKSLNYNSSIASRAYYYASPDGPLGVFHRQIKDAIIMGYLDRFLFIDYNKFCNVPRSQVKRIYDFFELDYYEHDLNNIESQLPFTTNKEILNSYKIEPNIEITSVNCVEYLGLELYEQYNKEIFWNALI